jgi:hypothetical protein
MASGAALAYVSQTDDLFDSILLDAQAIQFCLMLDLKLSMKRGRGYMLQRRACARTLTDSLIHNLR